MRKEIDQYLNNKNIFFLSPPFFGYEKDIIDELTSKGANVFFFEELEHVPGWKRNHLFKILFGDVKERWKRKLVNTLTSNNYDFLFVIKGTSLDHDILDVISNLKCKKILYQYDSIARYPKIIDLFPYFEDIYTFEYDDSQKFSISNIKFRPLFFSNKFYKSTNCDIKYKISSICSYYPERLEIISKVAEEFANKNVYFHVYIPFLKLVLNFHKIGISNLFYLKPWKINRSKLIDVMNKSSCILDIEFKNQNGLTIRTIETLGMDKKLITTNSSVIHYDFFKADNIFVLNKDNVKDIESFLSQPKAKISNTILRKYTIDQWCKDIFDNSITSFYRD